MAFNWCWKLGKRRAALLGLTNRGKHAQRLVGFRKQMLTRAALVGFKRRRTHAGFGSFNKSCKVNQVGLILNVWTCVVHRWNNRGEPAYIYALSSLSYRKQFKRQRTSWINKRKLFRLVMRYYILLRLCVNLRWYRRIKWPSRAIFYQLEVSQYLKELCHEIQPNWAITKCPLN